MGAVNDMLMVEEALRGKQVDVALAAANITLREEIARLREALAAMRDHHRLCASESATRALDEPERAPVHIARVERDRLFANKLDELLTRGPSPSESAGKGEP